MSADLNSLQAPNDDKQFEQLCLHVMEHLHKTLRGQAYGRNGQAQHGVDFYIEVPASDGSSGSVITQFIGVQCKHKDRLLEGELGVKELEVEVKKAKGFKPALTTFIIATSAPTDTKPQDKARELTAEHQKQNPQLFSVEVWFWEKIRDEFSKNRELRREVLDRFYPHLAPAQSAQHSVLHQLPTKPAHFTGRDEELAELENEIASVHPAGATISGVRTKLHGAPGVGKTALAIVLAHQLKDRYPEAQLYLNLRGAGTNIHGQHSTAVKPMTSAEAMQSIIHAFHPEEKLPEELAKLSVKYNGVLNDAGRVLLFLDNAADAAQIQPLLPPDNCLLLLTARSQFSLPGMAVRNIDCLRPEKSQELLRKLAKRIKGYEKETAELCGHLPLALEVFAGVVNEKKLYPVPDLLERLRKQPGELTKADAAFQVSYDLLADDLRRRWTLLAVFPASFDLAAAAAVWEEKVGPARDAMQALISASLVEWNEANGRFRLHDLVRQFCDGKLTEAERTLTKWRYAGHYRDVGNIADQLYMKGGENVLRGLELFDLERIHIEAAFDWLQCRKDEISAKRLFNLIGAVTYTSSLRFHPNQRVHWLEVQRNAANIMKNRRAEGSAFCNLGLAYSDLGEASKALQSHEKALAIARELGNQQTEANALSNLGNAYDELGDTNKAIQFFDQALVIARKIGDKRTESNALGSLGIASARLGDAHTSIKLCEQWLLTILKVGDRRGEASALINLGIAYDLLGDARKAVQFYERALIIAHEMGDQILQAKALGNLGIAYTALNDSLKAIECCDKQLNIVRKIGDQRGEGNAMWNSALALEKSGSRPQAITPAAAALEIYKAIEAPDAAKVRAKLAEWRGQA